MKMTFATVAAIAMIALLPAAASAQQTLNAVKQRGSLICGSSTGLAGFGLPDDKGQWTGIDVDFCRAMAAAIFNDATKVQFVPLSTKDRFTALRSGKVDVLSRNSTWTLSHDTASGLNWGATNYFDGQGFMVHKKLNVVSAKELVGALVCVQEDTTTELNLADFFRANNVQYESVAFATSTEALKAYETGHCDAYANDVSSLYSERLQSVNPDEHVVLPEVISKEPLGPAVRHGDDQWFDLMRWTHYAMVNAEELGITSKNIDEMMNSQNPAIRRFVGKEGEFGKSLGLTDDWAVRIVRLVGNYGEVFDRNLGEGSRLKIKRGLNELWTKGGLQYAPPIR